MNMRRYVGRFLLASLCLFLISTKFVDITVGAGFGRHPLEMAWTATGLAAMNFSLDYWAAAPALPAGSDPAALLTKMAARLGARDSRVFSGRAEGIRFANLQANMPGRGELVLMVQAEGTVTHVGIAYCAPSLPPDLRALERKVRLAVAGCAPRGRFYWTICGRYGNRAPGSAAWRAMWARVASAVGGIRRDDGLGENVVEIYTPLLPEAEGGRDGANLVLARRQERGSRAGLIVLASPSLGEAL